MEILPRGSDGSYFHEHLKGFSEITQIIKGAKRYHETGELGSDYTFQDQHNQAGVNQYARDPQTMKDITDQPTARTMSDKSIYQPAYRVSFKTPKPNETPIIQHSNELSLEEMRKIRDQLKKNPKSYVPKTPKNEKKARRSFKE